jgi:hypothetical protein
MAVLFPFWFSSLGFRPARFPCESIKKPQPEVRFRKRVLRAAALPVGPSLDQRRGLTGRTHPPSLYKWRANSMARK